MKNEKKQEKHKEKEKDKEENGINLMDKQLLLSATLGDTETTMKLIQGWSKYKRRG